MPDLSTVNIVSKLMQGKRSVNLTSKLVPQCNPKVTCLVTKRS